MRVPMVPSLVLGVLLTAAPAFAGAVGPSAYLQFSDSPWDTLPFSYFHLETFEDHLLNVPGVSASAGGVTSVVFGPSIHDSVDADDGVIDGSGLLGDSYFSASGSAGITFSFSSGVLGALPTHAGIVWTDGGAGAGVTFKAFGPGAVLLGTITAIGVGDGSNSGQTAEDRFFGWTDAGGISAIFISNTAGGIEVDHLQYGRESVGAAVPLPSASVAGLALLGALGTVGIVRRRRRTV